jgi:hypothetical protein
MRILVAVLLLAGCPPKKKEAGENLNPYHDVTPQKIKQKVEQIQQQEDERNEKKLEEMK